jgi:hypothetical protein
VPQPTNYEPGYDFEDFQADNPLSPLPANKLQQELDAISAATGAIIARAALIQRDDGAIKNGCVTADSLKRGSNLSTGRLLAIVGGYGADSGFVISKNAINPDAFEPIDFLEPDITGVVRTYATAPTEAQGNDGDHAFAQDTSVLYWKRSSGAGGWTLVGDAAGLTPTGTALHDVGAPASGLGANGDVYVDTATTLRYAKVSGTWLEVGYTDTTVGDSVDRIDARIEHYATLPYVDMASATTMDLGAAASDKVRITGTAAIISFGTAPAGTRRSVKFTDSLTLTYDVASMILPGGGNISTALNDTAEFVSLGAGNWVCTSFKDQLGVPKIGAGWAVYLTAPASGVIREKLSADRDYYVRTDGNDSNNGLANTSGGAFLTTLKAITVAMAMLDLNGFNVTVHVADGTYTSGVLASGPPVGSGIVTVVGNQATPANCIISTTSKSAIRATLGARLFVYGFKVQTTTSGNGVHADLGATINCNEMEYGACAQSHIEAGTMSYVQLSANYKISGSAVSHFHGSGEAANITCAAITLQFIADVTFSAYFAGTNRGSLEASGLVIDTNGHTVTGKRFVCHYNGTIVCDTQARNYFPGTIEGTEDNGGVYISNQGAIYDIQVAPQTQSPAPTVTPQTGSFANVTATAAWKRNGIDVLLEGQIAFTDPTGGSGGYVSVLTPNLVTPIRNVPVIAFNIDAGGGPIGGYVNNGGNVALYFPSGLPSAGQRVCYSARYMTQ